MDPRYSCTLRTGAGSCWKRTLENVLYYPICSFFATFLPFFYPNAHLYIIQINESKENLPKKLLKQKKVSKCSQGCSLKLTFVLLVNASNQPTRPSSVPNPSSPSRSGCHARLITLDQGCLFYPLKLQVQYPPPHFHSYILSPHEVKLEGIISLFSLSPIIFLNFTPFSFFFLTFFFQSLICSSFPWVHKVSNPSLSSTNLGKLYTPLPLTGWASLGEHRRVAWPQSSRSWRSRPRRPGRWCWGPRGCWPTSRQTHWALGENRGGGEPQDQRRALFGPAPRSRPRPLRRRYWRGPWSRGIYFPNTQQIFIFSKYPFFHNDILQQKYC